MEEFIGKKNLELNLTKSNVIAIGNSKERKRLKRALDKDPLTLCGKVMQEEKETKYLGFVISTNNNDSIHKTVTKRLGLVK